MSSIRIVDLVTPDRVVPTLYAGNKRQVIEKLSFIAARKSGLDHELVLRSVLEREDLTTFGIGRGIALPHAIVPGLVKPIGVFARLKQPVDFGAADGRLADLALLLLAPDKDPDILLRALSCVARRFRNRDVVALLRAENTLEAAHVILTTDFWRGKDPPPDRSHAA
ncbi:MAG: PTS sugar transporter subunit IIA [Rhodospirillales bacterium]|nr:PTS sugar transporter subunit IIA [Rhodospirillales bacterium]